MVLGAKKATGKDPEYIISYDAFSSNDSHCRVNFPETPYGIIREDDIAWDKPAPEDLYVDMVVSLCPCAGLSALNSSTKKDSAKARGSDAEQNHWMYASSRYILENVKPRVLWGENAPGLFTSIGVGVADKLYEIAKEYGYSFSIIKTSTSLHGIPQNRTRSFYFFWKSDSAPVLDWIRKDSGTLEDYIQRTPKGSYSEIFFMKDPLNEDPLYLWLRDMEKKTPREAALEGNRSILIYAFRDRARVLSAIEYLEKRSDKKSENYVKLFKRALEKRVWDSTPHLNAVNIPAVVGRTLQLSIHPTEPRWLNVQEIMWLMGMDDQFKLAHEGYTQISQNVPVNTAADWAEQVIKWLNGNLKSSGVDYFKQDNTNESTSSRMLASKKALF
jgi:site-specific DNA-cytosine methylase